MNRPGVVPLKPWQAYAFAIASTAITLIVRLALNSQLDGNPALVIFAVPIVLSAYLGGLRGGLLATLLTYLAASYYVLPPINDFHIASGVERWQQALVVLSGVVISVVSEALHRARKRADQSSEQHERAEAAFQQSEARYSALVTWSPEAVAVHRDGHMVFVNPAAVAMFGASAASDLVGKPILELIHPDSQGAALQRMKEAREGRLSAPMVELKALKRDGSVFSVEVQGTIIDYDGQPALLASMRDISVRKAHEVEIGRLNRMYAALSGINQAIVRMPSREQLLPNVCNALTEHGGMLMAWIGWRVPDTPTMAVVASAGLGTDFLSELRMYVDDRPDRTPSGTVYREGRPYVCNDMRTDPVMTPWRPGIEAGGFNACAIFPIREGGVVSGVLTVTAAEPDFFQDKEMALLIEAADDISFALDNLSRDAARKQAESALVGERDRFRSLFEYAPVGILIADPTGRYLDANSTMCTMTGYDRDELVGHDATLIVAPDETRHIPRALELITSTDDYRREWRFKRKDGTYFTAEVASISMPDGNLLASIRDVTERHEAIEAIQAAEERMRFALESANVGIWDMDYSTGVLQWSPTLEAHYGLAPGSFPGTFEAFAERVHPDDRASVLETLGRAMKTGSDFTVVNRALWSNGTVRHMTGAGRIILDERGEPIRGVGISLDLTEQRTLEAQFQQSQKMEAIGRLAGGVAHDFNNLLTVILGFCELLSTDLADSPHAADVAAIQHAGRSAAGLTRQLLAFSRKQIIEPMRLDLNNVVTDTRTMLSRVIGEDVSIVLGLAPDLAIVKVDRAQVEQVIMNLAVNARDAMPRGGTLTIETANVNLDADYTRTHIGVVPGQYVRLTVSDTGIGMSAEVQARLFEPFFTTKEVGKGTGLGLASVHGIVAGNGGSINVYSEPGVGSSFKVFLPIAGPDEPQVVATGLPAPHSDARHTVLVVDDADALRELTRRLLARLGYAVLVAANADEALHLFATNPSIDVLLTDVVMPGSSGPELGRKLLEQRPTLRVIYMSGYTDEAIGHHGVLNPGVMLLNKPFTLDALARKVREVLDQ